jgi:hypothetical protein
VRIEDAAWVLQLVFPVFWLGAGLLLLAHGEAGGWIPVLLALGMGAALLRVVHRVRSRLLAVRSHLRESRGRRSERRRACAGPGHP